MARRPVEWAGFGFDEQALPASGLRSELTIVDADDSGPRDFSFEHYTKPTIVRIVGELWVRLGANSSTVVTNYFARFMLGLMCADEDKPAEDPANELGHPWMWLAYGHLYRPMTGMPVYNGTSIIAEDYNVGGTSMIHYVLDVRTMRKVNRDCELRLVMKTIADSGDVSPKISGFIRCLIKE